MFSFIPSSSSSMSMTSTFAARIFNVIWIFRVQSTNVTSIVPCKHSRSFFRLTSELKICTNFPLNFDNFLHVLFPCDFPAFSGLNTYLHRCDTSRQTTFSFMTLFSSLCLCGYIVFWWLKMRFHTFHINLPLGMAWVKNAC